MTTSYKYRYEKLQKKNNELTRDMKQLVGLLLRIRKKCRDNNLWLGAGVDPKLPLDDAAQQGPLVTKLYDMALTLKGKL